MLCFKCIRVFLELPSSEADGNRVCVSHIDLFHSFSPQRDEERTSTSSSARNHSILSGEMSRCVSSRSIMMKRLRSSSDRMSCFTAASLPHSINVQEWCQQGGWGWRSGDRRMTYQVRSSPLYAFIATRPGGGEGRKDGGVRTKLSPSDAVKPPLV